MKTEFNQTYSEDWNQKINTCHRCIQALSPSAALCLCPRFIPADPDRHTLLQGHNPLFAFGSPETVEVSVKSCLHARVLCALGVSFEDKSNFRSSLLCVKYWDFLFFQILGWRESRTSGMLSKCSATEPHPNPAPNKWGILIQEKTGMTLESRQWLGGGGLLGWICEMSQILLAANLKMEMLWDLARTGCHENHWEQGWLRCLGINWHLGRCEN